VSGIPTDPGCRLTRGFRTGIGAVQGDRAHVDETLDPCFSAGPEQASRLRTFGVRQMHHRIAADRRPVEAPGVVEVTTDHLRAEPCDSRCVREVANEHPTRELVVERKSLTQTGTDEAGPSSQEDLRRVHRAGSAVNQGCGSWRRTE
jgi:hypothetical protein